MSADERILDAIDLAWYELTKGELQWEEDLELATLLLALHRDVQAMREFDYEGVPTSDRECVDRVALAYQTLHYGKE